MMTFVRWAFVLLVLLALPAYGIAQEATISGTITDSTGGVLPGVTITALHEASGNTFLAVSDGTGGYTLPVRTGRFRITAELQGFRTTTRAMELLIGQRPVVDLELAPSTVEESVVVSGEAPLIDVTTSSLGSNIDPTQMQELPLNGRNWADLTMLAPASRVNSVSDAPANQGLFQLNVDGQQVTQGIATAFGQPRFSRDAIAEFEVISNRFDATQGRSSGMQVNAITKSGTNAFAGSFAGYFRSDKFNAKDFVQNRVLPYSDQQISPTFGGPIVKNRIHFFAAYEYERNPYTFTYNSPWPAFNIDQLAKNTDYKASLRTDFQFSPKTRLSVRGNRGFNVQPIDPRFSGGASFHPSSAIHTQRGSDGINLTLTRVIGTRAVNEIRAGYSSFRWVQDPLVSWPNHPRAATGLTHGTPIITLRGYRIGQGHNFSYQRLTEQTESVRDDFTYSFVKAGRHDVKTGGEYLYSPAFMFHCTQCQGIIDAQGGPVPTNIQQLFPVWNDVSTWNLAALSPITRSYQITTGRFQIHVPEHYIGAWAQDDWHVTSNLTLNLGLRYNLARNIFGEFQGVEPFLEAGRPNDTNNIQPRVGLNYAINDRTVVRGGAGRFYSDIGKQGAHWVYLWGGQVRLNANNDGRPDFAANPFNGPIPNYEQSLALWQAGAFTRTITGTFSAPDNQVPFANEMSVGLQRQVGTDMSLTADYIYTAEHHDRVTTDVNLAYNPATGTPYPFNDLVHRPVKGWSRVDEGLTVAEYKVDQLALSFTKRLSHRWQASASYSATIQRNHQVAPVNPGCKYPTTTTASGGFTCDVPITLHPVLQDEWYVSDDQRHRATFNGIWDMGLGFQLSGVYLFGDSGWATATSGVDVMQFSGASGTANAQRLRADGTIIARRALNLPPMHRVDTRLQRRFRFGAHAEFDAILEAFNLFNHANFGSFTTVEANASYGKPTYNGNIAYQPRILQLGFRAAF